MKNYQVFYNENLLDSEFPLSLYPKRKVRRLKNLYVVTISKNNVWEISAIGSMKRIK